MRSAVAAKVGALAEADIQKRVSAAGCPSGSSIRVIDAAGSVTCQAANVTVNTDGGSLGISGVFGMAGLTGGGTTGDINLSVNFAGTGAAVTASRSDHNHLGAYLPLSTSLSCTGTDKVSAINATTGAVTCTADTTGAGGSGTVTSVATGVGLTGGPITTSGTIDLASTVQNWSTQPSCPTGSVLRAIGSGGVPSCSTAGTVTSVAAGAGLTGGSITGSGTLSIATGGVTASMLASSTITLALGGGLTGGGTVGLGGSRSTPLAARWC